MATPSHSDNCPTTSEPRFIVDVNVGRLAKWLRAMGYDSLFPGEIGDNELVRTALRDHRIIVTKDTGLTERRLVTTGMLKVLLIQHDDLQNQLRQVIKYLGTNLKRPFSRCIRCNEPLLDVAKDAAKDRVPPHVFRTQADFMKCPLCQRIYWRGTHWENMARQLAELKCQPV